MSPTTHSQTTSGEDEFVTIIGGDAEEIGQVFRDQGLAAKDFTIVHRIGRHRIAMAPGQDDMSALVGALLGGRLVAATYARRPR
ncbi:MULTISPECIES: hypothetical protein [Ancylobacter]|jgi:hypothetical protein|uniref:Uncharacterized protein n=2 Tax=Ancylobacter TaxID=99 RepID=A0A1G4TGL1_9HYPH|nr:MULTISPECIES: hypothetical protein [Ancylobacter]MDQ0348053.1 hypothetical protein [Ancylobacter vacuolatus]RTL95235.1 hypothetical protein EJV44_12815 [Ancylobacter aquaticus]SCW80501.1 hypothetical protein SAMN05660859_2953 [Ancylobacter rudongensis]